MITLLLALAGFVRGKFLHISTKYDRHYGPPKTSSRPVAQSLSKKITNKQTQIRGYYIT